MAEQTFLKIRFFKYVRLFPKSDIKEPPKLPKFEKPKLQYEISPEFLL
jgi:hypothetical protein